MQSFPVEPGESKRDLKFYRLAFYNECDFNSDFYLHMQSFTDLIRFDTIPGHRLTRESISEKSSMTRSNPSKCEKCNEELPSQRALNAHKAKMHPNKPPGPNPKAEKEKKVTLARREDGSKIPGSPAVMNNWISGNSRSTEVARALSSSAASAAAAAAAVKQSLQDKARQDTPRENPASPAVRSNSLNVSVSLLEEAGAGAASPMLNTVKMFPPQMMATPTGDEVSSWVVTNAQVEAEPEKKRGRENDDENLLKSEKKMDEKRTPDNIKAQRNIEPELSEAAASLNTLEMEFETQEVESQEWIQDRNNLAQLPPPRAESDLDMFATLKPSEIDRLSGAEHDWLTNTDFDFIPDRDSQDTASQETVSQMSQFSQASQSSTQQLAEAEQAEARFEQNEMRQEIIEDLRIKLDEAMSKGQEYYELIEQREAEIELLKSELQQTREHLASNSDSSKERELTDRAMMAEAKLTSMEDTLNAKMAELSVTTNQLALVKSQALEMVERAKVQVGKVKTQAEIEAQAKIESLEKFKRAEVERLRAINTQTMNELKKAREVHNETANLKAALVIAEGERDKEKHSATKANEMMAKLENIVREAQEDKAKNEKRISELEHSNKTMARKLPCGRENCDHGCGRDHHCGFGSSRNRSRNRGRRSRGNSEGSDTSAPPIMTANNLAMQAGCSTEAMGQVINSVNNTLDPSRLPPRRPESKQAGKKGDKWKVRVCPNYAYAMCCPRGQECKNAHELVGAKDMAKITQGNPAIRPNVTQVQPRGKIPLPSFHPDHPWASIMQQNGNTRPAQASGNGSGQRAGAPAVQRMMPQGQAQMPAPTAQAQIRPSSFKEAVSGTAAARQIVGQSLSQIATEQSRLQAVQDPIWRDRIDSVFQEMVRSSQTSTNSPSQKSLPSTPMSGTNTPTSSADQGW